MDLRSKRSVIALFLNLFLVSFGFSAQAGSIFSRYSRPLKGLSVVGAVAGLGYLSYALWQKYKAYNSFEWKMAQKIENKPEILEINGKNGFYSNPVESLNVSNCDRIFAQYKDGSSKQLKVSASCMGATPPGALMLPVSAFQKSPWYGRYKDTAVVGSTSYCNKYKAIGFKKTVLILDAKDDSVLATLKGHTGCVSALTWSYDGRTIVSGDLDGTIIVWKR